MCLIVFLLYVGGAYVYVQEVQENKIIEENKTKRKKNSHTKQNSKQILECLKFFVPQQKAYLKLNKNQLNLLITNKLNINTI